MLMGSTIATLRDYHLMQNSSEGEEMQEPQNFINAIQLVLLRELQTGLDKHHIKEILLRLGFEKNEIDDCQY